MHAAVGPLHRTDELEVVLVRIGERRDPRVGRPALHPVRLAHYLRTRGLELGEIALHVGALDVDEEPAGLAPYVGGTGPLFPTSLARHFWESFGFSARVTLHVVVLRAARPGSQADAHHVLEAQFKAVARALRDAVRIEDPAGGVPSTKGVL